VLLFPLVVFPEPKTQQKAKQNESQTKKEMGIHVIFPFLEAISKPHLTPDGPRRWRGGNLCKMFTYAPVYAALFHRLSPYPRPAAI